MYKITLLLLKNNAAGLPFGAKNPQTGNMVERHLWTKNPHIFFVRFKKHLIKQFSRNLSGKK